MGVFAMPSLGADMESGTLVEWLTKPGETVSRGDVVAVVETQKGAIEIEIFEEGRVEELVAEIGATLPVGAPLAVIRGPGEAVPAPGATAPMDDAKERVVPEEAPKPAPAVQSPPDPVEAPKGPNPAPKVAPMPRPPGPGHPVASPAARVRARELGRELAGIEGTGPDGAILLADLDRPATAMPQGKAVSPMEEMRKAIAAAMTRSKQTIPHFYLSQTIDLQPATDFLERRNAGRPPSERVLMGALFVRATTLAAVGVPGLSGQYVDGGFQPGETVNTALVVALRGGGLVAPAISDAASLDLDGTMAAMRDLVSRARAGRLRSSEMTMGTITVSLLGESGAEAMSGVIFPPQVALVAVGAPQQRPWIVEGAVVPRMVATLTVSADHRVSDGRKVARFLAKFEDLMKEPQAL